jgi:D-cysteine desulfhydrase
VLLLRGEKPKHFTSNNLLDQLFGAEIFYLSNEQYYNQDEIRQAIDAQIRSLGGKSYYIPEGGSNALGTMGYLSVFEEILEQLKEEKNSLPPSFDSIVVAHGSGGTQAGLVLGKILHEKTALGEAKVIGVNVCYDKERSFRLVKDILWSAIQQFHMPLSFLSEDIQILDGFVGRGYAQSTREELQFLKKVASTEGLLLDPVYTGKALYGLSETVKKKDSLLGKNILFIHTGGAFGDFQLNAEWSEALV